MTTQRTQASTLTMILLGAMLIGMAPTATADDCGGGIDERCTYPEPIRTDCGVNEEPEPGHIGTITWTVGEIWYTTCIQAAWMAHATVQESGDMAASTGTIVIAAANLADADAAMEALEDYAESVGLIAGRTYEYACVAAVGAEPVCFVFAPGSMPAEQECPADASIPSPTGGVVGQTTDAMDATLQSACAAIDNLMASAPGLSDLILFSGTAEEEANNIGSDAVSLTTAGYDSTCWALFGPDGCDSTYP